MVNADNCQLLAMWAGFEARPLHVGLWWTKWYWDIFYSENIALPLSIVSKISLHIHECNLDALKFDDFYIRLYRMSQEERARLREDVPYVKV